jgi:hypothetical protein
MANSRQKIYQLRAEVWLYPGMAAWHFITLPKKAAAEIKENFSFAKRGWGSLPVIAKIGQTSWKTSIFPDRKINSYLLPLKAEVRKKEKIQAGDKIKFSVDIMA